jgi:hypothetical protein
LGGFKRAELELAEKGTANRYVTVLSDLRQASCDGRLNLTRPPENPTAMLADLQSRGLIPDLTGVRVRAVGVHTHAFTPQQWDRLRRFWSGFFARSNAVLTAYSPNLELAVRP